MTVRLHIERLVLDGLEMTSAEAMRVEASIASELTARFAAGAEAEWTSFSVPALEPLYVDAEPSQDPAALGRHVAAGLYGGLKP